MARGASGNQRALLQQPALVPAKARESWAGGGHRRVQLAARLPSAKGPARPLPPAATSRVRADLWLQGRSHRATTPMRVTVLRGYYYGKGLFLGFFYLFKSLVQLPKNFPQIACFCSVTASCSSLLLVRRSLQIFRVSIWFPQFSRRRILIM